MKIISYESFNNQEDFIGWQKKNKCSIINISPIPNTVGINQTSDSKIDGDITFNIFVTFVLDDDKTTETGN